MGRGPKFIPRGFENVNTPSGADPGALRELRHLRGETDEDEAEEAAPAVAKGAKGRGDATSQRTRGRKDEGERPSGRQVRDDANDDDDDAPIAAPRPRRGGRPAKEDRVQRVVRLTAQLDTRLRQLAEFRGIDLNAAVSVAIAEDWSRTCRSQRDRS